ncbi:hypothetical protein DFK10_02145 [Salibaculum griseiflavum]|uniref:Uncharacterized protein n=1 Tax=Salibaculum griseiflavum TaxID=1914409 RepID=A0A2V1P9T1_9RHOB|nr:hypothetical protein DFK10_02145 [Salibaculum griseiflavum]
MVTSAMVRFPFALGFLFLSVHRGGTVLVFDMKPATNDALITIPAGPRPVVGPLISFNMIVRPGKGRSEGLRKPRPAPTLKATRNRRA